MAKSKIAPRWQCGLIALSYGVFGLLLLWPLPAKLLSAIPGDGFDGWQNYWNLWWVREALLRLGNWPWQTELLDYPRGASLIFHTLNIPNAIISLPVQELLGVAAAYNFVVFLSFALGGLGTYLLSLRAMKQGNRTARAGAFVAGLVFSLSPFHFAHLLGHMQVFAFQWLPFYALVLLSLLNQVPRYSINFARLALAIVFLVMAVLVDWYNLVYLAFLTALWATWFGWHNRRSGWGGILHPWLVSAAIAFGTLLLLSPLLVPMLREAGRDNYMVPEQWQVLALSADAQAYFLPQEMHPLWGDWARKLASRYPISTSERMISLGIVPVVLACVAWWWNGRQSRPFVWMALLFLLLSLGPVLRYGGTPASINGQPLTMPYLLLYRLFPMLGIARSVGRYSVMAVLAVAALAGMGVSLLSRRKSASPVLLPSIAAVLVILEFIPSPFPLSPLETPSWYYALAAKQGGEAILNLPANWDRPQYLLYQTVHQHPLISGYISRRNPESTVEHYPGLQQLRALGSDVLAFPDAETFATIAQDLNLKYVVLDTYQMPGEDEREATLSIATALLDGENVSFQDERLTVYLMDVSKQRRAYARLDGPWGPRLDSATGSSVRAACDECAVTLIPAPGCSAEMTIRCESGVEQQFTGKEQLSVVIGTDLPQCRVLQQVTWSGTCDSEELEENTDDQDR